MIAEHLWYTKLNFGMRCDLTDLPPVRPARVDVKMKPCRGSVFGGFTEELKRVRGHDYAAVLLRELLCESDICTLYVAHLADGSPIYAQWLVRYTDQHRLRGSFAGRYISDYLERTPLRSGEVLVEGAYTFSRFRGMGAMTDGMVQLLRIARDEGARSARTSVVARNVPALRGCAKVGFNLDSAQLSVRRLGRRRNSIQPVDERVKRLWVAALS
jgi:RimJ/RimL family protein N-acetyltransferase